MKARAQYTMTTVAIAVVFSLAAPTWAGGPAIVKQVALEHQTATQVGPVVLFTPTSTRNYRANIIFEWHPPCFGLAQVEAMDDNGIYRVVASSAGSGDSAMFRARADDPIIYRIGAGAECTGGDRYYNVYIVLEKF